MQVAAHEVPVVARKQDQVAGRHFEHFAPVGQPNLAVAFGQKVEEHHMLGPGKALRALVRRNLGDTAPVEIVDDLRSIGASASASSAPPSAPASTKEPA